MNKTERSRLIRERARELADSGKYQNYFGVEGALRSEGLPGIPDNELFREELDLACQRATGKPAYGDEFVIPSSERAR